ncbi:DUF1835 domain-containing protein [Geomesophilobacter sediminis]|uniref:DUF1835 domain-containing protein n=1 Tax=Geomesophilobacter sediminis TaxID=2798584 RepID=A0A8J7J6T6_9BACT|nr:DUF1835 domain-containing protein [Geomesophilobacter sediminis]MBJ6724601.1 DUF1835 domain-containing protein [Geomesophilobacter sediminis]
MTRVLHITSGDIAGENLKQSGVTGDLLVWHDILYEGPRNPGWPEEETLLARTQFLDEVTDGGLGRQHILETLRDQYRKLETASGYDAVILWFDACLFDQSMLSHILACLKIKGVVTPELICVAAFPGIEPYNGIGQLSPQQLASVYGQRSPVTAEQVGFAERVDRAFALQDLDEFALLAKYDAAPLPYLPAAVDRWLKEQPDPETGLGLLEQLALDAIRSGCHHPWEIFRHVAAHDTPPQYWGDSTLWAKINRLATLSPPLVKIEGPSGKLPQWISQGGVESYLIYPL